MYINLATFDANYNAKCLSLSVYHVIHPCLCTTSFTELVATVTRLINSPLLHMYIVMGILIF